MAYTTLVNDDFFERYMLPALRDLDSYAATGPLQFAMLVPSSYDDNYRSLVVASAALDRLGRSEGTDVVLERLRTTVGRDAKRIQTVSVLPTDSLEIHTLSNAFHIQALGGAYRGGGQAVAALDLHEPIIFLSRKLAEAA